MKIDPDKKEREDAWLYDNRITSLRVYGMTPEMKESRYMWMDDETDNTRPYNTIPFTHPYDGEARGLSRFRTLTDFVMNTQHLLDNRIRHNERDEDSSSNRGKGSNTFDSFREALEHIKKDVKMPANIQSAYKQMSQRFKLLATDSGGEINIPDYLSGKPEHFTDFEKARSLQPKVSRRIFIDVAVPYHISSERYEALINCIMEFIIKNIQFEQAVMLCNTIATGGRSRNLPSQYFDIQLLHAVEFHYKELPYMARTAFTDFFRRFIWLQLEQFPALPGGYGQPTRPYMENLTAGICEPGDLYISLYNLYIGECRVDDDGKKYLFFNEIQKQLNDSWLNHPYYKRNEEDDDDDDDDDDY